MKSAAWWSCRSGSLQALAAVAAGGLAVWVEWGWPAGLGVVGAALWLDYLLGAYVADRGTQ